MYQQDPQQMAEQQRLADQQHLRLLSIFHYVYGGFAFLGICFVVGHFFLMRFVMTNAASTGMKPAEAAQIEQMFGFFIAFYILIGIFCLLLGIGNILSGSFLGKRRHRIFIMVVSGFNCLNVPLGTILGIFTFIVLLRPSVTMEFERPADR